MVCLVLVSIAGPAMLMTVDHSLKENRFTRWIVRLLQWPSGQADEHYRLAERYFQALDLEKTTLECEKALRLESKHAPAKALHVEVQFILGQGKATPNTGEYDKFMSCPQVMPSQILLEVENAVARGMRAYDRGELETASRELRKCREYLKWMPKSEEASRAGKKASALLGVVSVIENFVSGGPPPPGGEVGDADQGTRTKD